MNEHCKDEIRSNTVIIRFGPGRQMGGTSIQFWAGRLQNLIETGVLIDPR